MSRYTLPRPAFDVLAEALGKAKADLFATAIEQTISDVQAEARRSTETLRNEIKNQVKDDMRNKLVTRGILDEKFAVVEERFKVMDEKFRRLDFKLNIFIAIALIALTFANPTFVELVKHVIK